MKMFQYGNHSVWQKCSMGRSILVVAKGIVQLSYIENTWMDGSFSYAGNATIRVVFYYYHIPPTTTCKYP
jgi:hypothetical protein